VYFCEEKHYFGGIPQRPTAKEEINKWAQGRMAVKAGGNNGDGGCGCEGRRRTTGGGGWWRGWVEKNDSVISRWEGFDCDNVNNGW
jgi:hypothetical protein